jgi:hypothetical protein
MKPAGSPAKAPTEFIRRGLESLTRARQSGKYHPATKVLRELRADLSAARKRAGGTSK